MKKRGLTLIETVVVIALVGVVFLLMTPIIKSFGRVNTRVMTQKEVYKEFSNISEFIQKKIRSAKRSSKSSGSITVKYVGVFDTFSSTDSLFFTSANKKADGEEGSVLFLEVPDTSGGSEFVFFIFEDNKLKYREGFGGTNETLMNDVEDANFRFQEDILVYYINLDIGDYEGRLRDSLRSSASTRIDIQ